jgi:hypothetical protein
LLYSVCRHSHDEAADAATGQAVEPVPEKLAAAA